MCDECRQLPCHPRCPNALPPRDRRTCQYCDNYIVPDEEYVQINGYHYHYECLTENYTAGEILELLDVDVREVE